MSLTKALTITLTGITGVVGLYASWLWLKASKINPDPGWLVEPGETEAAHTGHIYGILAALSKSGNLNARAARWTASAVVLGTITSVVGNWPV